ncbi:MAG: VOC family protein, partial [Pseudomonadota bacterium]
MAQVRYIVQDVDDAVEFYSEKLGFALEQQFGPAMAILSKDDLQLWLAGPPASA